MGKDKKRLPRPLTLGMYAVSIPPGLIDHDLEDEERLSQPLSLGLVRSICLDLLADSAPSTKLVAIAIIRRIDSLSAGHARKSGSRKRRKEIS